MHVVCLILEYFPLKPGSLKILLPLLQKNKVEVWPEHFCSRLNNIDLGRVRGGVTMVPNSRAGSPGVRKCKVLWIFCLLYWSTSSFCLLFASVIVPQVRSRLISKFNQSNFQGERLTKTDYDVNCP